MRVRGIGAATVLIGTILTFLNPFDSSDANATTLPSSTGYKSARHDNRHGAMHARSHVRHVARSGGISCVPFARNDSGISLTGNAWLWWQRAAGVYARGKVPEQGAVLAFRANPSMRLGHVAVVRTVINAREVEIDHANWSGYGGRGRVARGVPVVDVSEANDWSAVRVELARGQDFGSVYPTYGFIYDRPDNGTIVAGSGRPAPQQIALNPAPRDLRPWAERPWQTYEEVAEVPAEPLAEPDSKAGQPVGGPGYRSR